MLKWYICKSALPDMLSTRPRALCVYLIRQCTSAWVTTIMLHPRDSKICPSMLTSAALVYNETLDGSDCGDEFHLIIQVLAVGYNICLYMCVIELKILKFIPTIRTIKPTCI